MTKNDKMKAKQSLLNHLDIFGVSYNFLVEDGNKKKTIGGAILSILYGFIFIGLFFGFGIDLYQRKRPKVSFSTVIGNYKEISLSNKNFTHAFRIEDTLARKVTDETVIYNFIGYFKYTLVNGTWIMDFQKQLENKKCRELPNIEEKEKYYNLSLHDWNCIDFDNITLGGNWDGNFVYGIIINTYQCNNLTIHKNCSSKDFIKQSFQSDITSSNLFYSQLSMQALASMDDFENPLKTTLVNQYDLLNIGLSKRKVQTFKSTKMINDVGWFFPDENEFSMACEDSVSSDFTFKDPWSQDVLFSQFLYYGKKFETYNRSYTKIQEVFAAIGGFAKIFYFSISLLFFAIKKIYSNIFLMNNFIFENSQEESTPISNNKFRSFSEIRVNILEEILQNNRNGEVKEAIITKNIDSSVQIDNYLNENQNLSHNYKSPNINFLGKCEPNSSFSEIQHKINSKLPKLETNPTNHKPSINVNSCNSINDFLHVNSLPLNNVNREEIKKLPLLESRNITFFDYFKYRCICVNKNFKISGIGTKLKIYVLCEKYFMNKLDILSYFDLHNQFRHFTKLFLEKQDRKLLKNIPLNLSKYENKKKSLNTEIVLINDAKNTHNIQQQVIKPDSQSDSCINKNQNV